MSLEEIGFTEEVVPRHICVKESVLPFIKFPGVDMILGPEMKSTGEVMGVDNTFGGAYGKIAARRQGESPRGGEGYSSA